MHMKNNIAILFGMVLSCMVCSCTNENNGKEKSDGGFRAKTGEAVRDSSISHARYFAVSECGNYTAVDVKDPWNGGAVAATYYVVYNDSVQTPSDGYKIKVPVKNIALNSCSHIGFTDMLGCIDKVIGMSSAKYVYNSNLRRRIAAGDCVDIGDSFALNFEKTATLPVEAVMVTLYNNPDKNIERLIQTGIPVIYNVEWMEPDILGRAEWIKFFGVFYDRRQEADSIFNDICKRYETLAKKASSVEYRPSIIAGMPFKGTWYMPAGDSFMARLFETAGGSYKYAGSGGTGSLPLNLETVMADFSECDVWLGTDAASLAEIENSDARLTSFKAFKDGNVYNQRKRSTADGGNDFWETGVARPDLILQDLIRILHPGLSDDSAGTFFMEKLK